MKILVTIASFGIKNDKYLKQVIQEYHSMSHRATVVVFSNIQKDFGEDARCVVVDLKGKDPHTLPFVHKRIMTDHLNEYDLFVYSEDDTLISQRNLDAFLRVSAVLPEDEIPGFLNTEVDGAGALHFCNVSSHFHWDPAFFVTRGEFRFARFTNEHSASFVLTQAQLRRAIDSGGFLVGPHEGRYNWACTAATDPYTQCGFKKVICISHLEDFLIRHLPGKYYHGRPYGSWEDMKRQLDALARVHGESTRPESLFHHETNVLHAKWSKNFYEPVSTDIVSLVPKSARSVLSLGCAWGAIEGQLAKRGMRVVGVPMDPVIAACAHGQGIEIVYGDLNAAREKLGNETFDCLLLLDVLHLVPEPVAVLRAFGGCLSEHGVIIATAPNLGHLVVQLEKVRGNPYYKCLGDYATSGLHQTSARVLGEWFKDSGLRVNRMIKLVSGRRQRADQWTLGLARAISAEWLIAVGERA